MSKTKLTLSTFIRENLLAISVQMVGVLVVILNLWLFNQLAPIRQDIAIIASQVEQNTDNLTPKNEVTLQLIEINRRLEKIEIKLDTHINR